MAQKVVIALGGNAILQPKQEATYENQLDNVRQSTEIIAEIVKSGYKVIITHGNGPQVGNILRQNELAKDTVPSLPLDVCSADRKSTRLNSSHVAISYAVFCLKKKTITTMRAH